VRIFKDPWFARFASKEGIQDSDLKEIVNTVLNTGQADANLGGGVYKVRVARPGEGKSGGYRVIVFYRLKERTVFHSGFAKSALGNINRRALDFMKKQAKLFFALSDEQIDMQVANGTLLEIS
jgi:hypothetical protein